MFKVFVFIVLFLDFEQVTVVADVYEIPSALVFSVKLITEFEVNFGMFRTSASIY